jgi:hypothetical protein
MRFQCKNCDTEHGTPEEAIECCQCESCVRLAGLLRTGKDLMQEHADRIVVLEQENARVLMMARAFEDDIKKLEAQLKVVREWIVTNQSAPSVRKHGRHDAEVRHDAADELDAMVETKA